MPAPWKPPRARPSGAESGRSLLGGRGAGGPAAARSGKEPCWGRGALRRVHVEAAAPSRSLQGARERFQRGAMTSATSRWREPDGPHTHSQKPLGRSAQSVPAACHQERFPLSFLCVAPGFATQPRSEDGSETSRGVGGRRGEEATATGPGAAGRRLPVPAGALRAAPRPSEDQAARRRSHAGAAAALSVPGPRGRHPDRRPPRPPPTRRAHTRVRTHPWMRPPGPAPTALHLRGAHQPGPAPTPGPIHLGRARAGPHLRGAHPPGRTHRGPHPPWPRAHAVRTYPGRRSPRSARSPAAAAAPGRPSAAPWPWQRCRPPEMPEPGRGRGVSTPLR